MRKIDGISILGLEIRFHCIVDSSLYDLGAVILQCEDRIFQMIDGIENSIKAQNDKFEKYRIEIEEEFKASIRHDMIKFYTIQDQRDLALGNEIKDEEEASELTFF